MKKIIIPTKLDKAAAAALVTAGYEVVQDDATPLAEQASKHQDAAGLIVRLRLLMLCHHSSASSVREQGMTTLTTSTLEARELM